MDGSVEVHLLLGDPSLIFSRMVQRRTFFFSFGAPLTLFPRQETLDEYPSSQKITDIDAPPLISQQWKNFSGWVCLESRNLAKAADSAVLKIRVTEHRAYLFV